MATTHNQSDTNKQGQIYPELGLPGYTSANQVAPVHQMSSGHNNTAFTGPGIQPTAPITNQPSIVTNQPLPTNTVVINNQPIVIAAKKPWSVGWTDCCANPKHCLCYLFCQPCYLGCQATRMDEHCCAGCCLGPMGLLSMRSKLRGKHNLEGGICGDYCLICWCGPCAACQTSVEMDRLGYRD